jgi:cytochrome P450
VTATSDTNDTTASLPEFPPARPASCPFDPHSDFAQWRESGGLRRVNWNGHTVWAVSRYEDIKAALSDPRISADTMGKLLQEFPSEEAAAPSIPIFPRMDDPEHNRIRRVFTKDFTVRRIQSLRPVLQQIVDEALDAMIAKGAPTDLVSDFAFPVPTSAISVVLGVPHEDHEFFNKHSNVMIDAGATKEEKEAATLALFVYLSELIERMEKEPVEGLISRVLHEHVASGDLDRVQLAANCVLLLEAGHETTASMIGLSTLYLLQNPEAAATIRNTDDPKMIAGAIEELLRYLTIVTSQVERIAAEDVEIGGQLIRAGEGLIMNLPAANRDPGFFDDPDAFDVGRGNRAHLAFGYGTHQCVGQVLARAELDIAIPTLLRRLPSLRLDVPLESVKLRSGAGVFGVNSMPVAW